MFSEKENKVVCAERKKESLPWITEEVSFLWISLAFPLFRLSQRRNDSGQPLTVLPQQTHLSPYGSGRDSPNAAAGPGLWSGHCVLWGKRLPVSPEKLLRVQSLHVQEAVVRSREWGQNGHSLHRCSRKVAGGKHMTLMSSVSPAEARKPGQHRGQVSRWALC